MEKRLTPFTHKNYRLDEGKEQIKFIINRQQLERFLSNLQKQKTNLRVSSQGASSQNHENESLIVSIFNFKKTICFFHFYRLLMSFLYL